MPRVLIFFHLRPPCISRGQHRQAKVLSLLLFCIVLCFMQMTIQQAVMMKNINKLVDQFHDDNPWLIPSPINADGTAEESFSKLELFASAYPGNDESFGGFAELQESFIRSAQFFWPSDKFKITIVLDDTVCDNTPSAQGNVSSRVRSLFRPDFASKVNVRYNPLSNNTIYGKGWFIQQLIMFWADNFTDAEYIGFVDDDTIISRAVHASELFDDLGRPRAIVRHMLQSGQLNYIETTHYAFQKPALVYAMDYFPVIIKREHLKLMRQKILDVHTEFSYFDEFYLSLNTSFSQFCMMMDYCFFHHKDSYSWHFEESLDGWGKTVDGNRHRKRNLFLDKQRKGEIYPPNLRTELGVTDEMINTPFPRVSVHGSYLFPIYNQKQWHWARTKEGRRHFVSETFKDGYCFSLPNNRTKGTQETARCGSRRADSNNIYVRGEWRFQNVDSHWLVSNRTATSIAHSDAMARNVEHDWDEDELKILFKE